MDNILAIASLLTPVVVGVTEVVKRTTGLDDDKITLASLIIGILLGVAAMGLFDGTKLELIWAGGISGLAAMGLFDLGKSLVPDKKEEK